MKRCTLIGALGAACLTLPASLVTGFAPPMMVPAQTQCGTTTTAKPRTTIVYPRSCSHRHHLASSQNDSDQHDSSDAIQDSEELDDYDFQAGFQDRLKKEGGVTGIKTKAAARSVDSVIGSIKSKIFRDDTADGLLLPSGWSLTVGFLALVVVLAIGSHFASPAPFETSSNGEQLGFGVR